MVSTLIGGVHFFGEVHPIVPFCLSPLKTKKAPLPLGGGACQQMNLRLVAVNIAVGIVAEINIPSRVAGHAINGVVGTH